MSDADDETTIVFYDRKGSGGFGEGSPPTIAHWDELRESPGADERTAAVLAGELERRRALFAVAPNATAQR